MDRLRWTTETGDDIHEKAFPFVKSWGIWRQTGSQGMDWRRFLTETQEDQAQ